MLATGFSLIELEKLYTLEPVRPNGNEVENLIINADSVLHIETRQPSNKLVVIQKLKVLFLADISLSHNFCHFYVDDAFIRPFNDYWFK